MSTALPTLSEVPSGPPPMPASPAPVSDRDSARAIALLMEGLLTEKEFGALTGIAPQDLPQLLADSARLAEVQRVAMELRDSGALARLEALRHSRDAVSIAAEIMRDSEMHASTRLNAAAYVAKVAGTERAPVNQAAPQRISIRINFQVPGDPSGKGRVVVDGTVRPVPPRNDDVIEGEFSDSQELSE